jgi:manganese/zinc/iron transport system permease protein
MSAFDLIIPGGYNAQISLLAAILISGMCSYVGMFAVLSKKALLSDVASHATLPGIAIGLLVFWALGAASLALKVGFVIAGGFMTSGLGVFCVAHIQRHSTLKSDAAMAIVLSTFYGLGIALFSALQRIPSLSIAGMDRFLLGQIVGTTWDELVILGAVCLCVFAVVTALYRPLICAIFDPESFALSAQNFAHRHVLVILMILITLSITVGLKIAGALMIVAFMIFPVTTARLFIGDHKWLGVASVGVGIISAYTGVMMSLTFNDIPAGSMMVLSAFTFFVLAVVVKRIKVRCVA